MLVLMIQTSVCFAETGRLLPLRTAAAGPAQAGNAAAGESAPEATENSISGWTKAKTFNGHTYQAFFSRMDWHEADRFCREQGGHLASIETEAEQKFMNRYLGGDDIQGSYWIGLITAKNGIFKEWVTRETIDYTNWADGCPQAHDTEAVATVSAEAPGVWTDRESDRDDPTLAGFICEWEEEYSEKAFAEMSAGSK